MATLTLNNIQKSFGSVVVLDNIDMEIKDREFVALVGPSGCGKSTLLRMIAGLEGISVGEIKIGEKVVNRLRPRERDVAMVFQSYALYPHMTVQKNMAYTLKLAKLSKNKIESQIKNAAEILGLVDLLDRFPKQLSGGQRQRVAMGRAIVRNPEVFLFDEPLSNLDAKLRVQMRTEIKTLHNRLGTTTVYVTHDQVEAMTMADRVVIMNGGKIQQMGTPLELYDTPANVFVAGFMGSPAMNLLPGAIKKGAFVSDGGLSLPLTENFEFAEQQRVVYGLRPEHIELRPNGMKGEVVVVEPTGSEIHIVVKLGELTLSITSKERLNLRSSDEISIAPLQGSAHVFDESTGERLEIKKSSP